MFDHLWVEKYRPKNLDDIALPPGISNKFKEYTETQECPNLLFIGNAGIGKTSLAKIVVNDILKCQYLYINASDENGIDTIRSKVVNFARTKSLDGHVKVIILDEVDGLTLDAQRALRNTMEEYAAICRFILTANYSHRVITPLQSRAQSYDLTPSGDQCFERVCHVLTQEKIKFKQEDVKQHVQLYCPDLRKCINEAQKNTVSDEFKYIDTKKQSSFIGKIYALTNKQSVMKLRPKIIENEHAFNGDYPHALKLLFNHICESKLPVISKQEQMLIVSEYIYRSSFVLDQEINFFSCLLSLAEKN